MSSIKLTPQYIFALVLLGCVLLGYLFYSQLIQPRQLEITTLNGEIEQRQLQLSADQGKAAQVLTLSKEVDRLEVERERFLQALPPTANFGQVITNIKQTVSAAGGDLKSLGFSGGAADPNLPAGVKPIGITMTIDGQFPQLFEILRNLELQGRFTTVDTVGLQAQSSDSVQGNQGKKLSGNMGLTVYTFDAAQAAAGGTTPAAPGTPAPAPAAPSAPAPGGTQ